ncbi:MAG: hypothetical protein ACXVDE_08380 [Tumebacillaceae bacterium]
MEKTAEFFMEQTQKNTTHLFEALKHSVTASVEMLNWAQGEAQQITTRLTQQGTEQFVAQLEKLQAQQVEAQKEFQEQFRSLVNLFQNEGK